MTNTAEKRKKLEADAKALGHTPLEKSVELIDSCDCSCGWKGRPFFDGREYAMAQWRKHAHEAVASRKTVMNLTQTTKAP